MIRISGISTIALGCLLLACGPTDTAEKRAGSPTSSPGHTLDPEQVPEAIRHLVPLAGQWGIGDDTERMEQIERSSASDRRALAAATAPHHATITAWLDSFGGGAMTDEAAAFMYMQLAIEEMR